MGGGRGGFFRELGILGCGSPPPPQLFRVKAFPTFLRVLCAIGRFIILCGIIRLREKSIHLLTFDLMNIIKKWKKKPKLNKNYKTNDKLKINPPPQKKITFPGVCNIERYIKVTKTIKNTIKFSKVFFPYIKKTTTSNV